MSAQLTTWPTDCATRQRCLHCGALLTRRDGEKRHKFLARQYCGREHFEAHQRQQGASRRASTRFLGDGLRPGDKGREAVLYGAMRYEDVRLKA